MSHIRIIRHPIQKLELHRISKEIFGDMLKCVVDCERRIMAVGGELHSDEEQFLLEDGSRQEDVWGINIWFEDNRDDPIEFDSMINIRPRQNNRSRFVEDPQVRSTILTILSELII